MEEAKYLGKEGSHSPAAPGLSPSIVAVGGKSHQSQGQVGGTKRKLLSFPSVVG